CLTTGFNSYPPGVTIMGFFRRLFGGRRGQQPRPGDPRGEAGPPGESAQPIANTVRRLAEAGHEDGCKQLARAAALELGQQNAADRYQMVTLLGPNGQPIPARQAEAADCYQALVDRCNHWLQHEETLRNEYRGVLATAAANLGRLLSIRG